MIRFVNREPMPTILGRPLAELADSVSVTNRVGAHRRRFLEASSIELSRFQTESEPVAGVSMEGRNRNAERLAELEEEIAKGREELEGMLG